MLSGVLAFGSVLGLWRVLGGAAARLDLVMSLLGGLVAILLGLLACTGARSRALGWAALAMFAARLLMADLDRLAAFDGRRLAYNIAITVVADGLMVVAVHRLLAAVRRQTAGYDGAGRVRAGVSGRSS